MTSGMLFAALLGLAIQGVVIYVAIRLALVHDRTAPAKKAANDLAEQARKGY